MAVMAATMSRMNSRKLWLPDAAHRRQRLDDQHPARALDDLGRDEPPAPGRQRDLVRVLAQEPLRQRQRDRHREQDEPGTPRAPSRSGAQTVARAAMAASSANSGIVAPTRYCANSRTSS